MIKNLIKAIHSDDTLESMKQFESIWNQKVSDALQAKRVQVGREIFGESVEEPEEELTLEDFSEDVNSIELVLSEELLTEATKPSNLEAGKKYIMHDGPHKDPVRFNGWTGDDEKHSESVKYKSFKDIPGVKSLKDIEDKHDAKIKEHGMKDGYGKQHYAHLTALKKDGSDDYHFQAYVHKGKLRVGTGASHATFHDHGE